ncbi:MAG: restriction endonuclease subunit S domain-containing protein [Acidimicrobiales bacterium]|jgi:type I restriction enzyme S subunit
MTADLKPYPAYKDSGVPWLGDVPEHWEVRRLKNVCTRSAFSGANISASSYSLDGIRFLRTMDMRDDGSLEVGGVHVSPKDAVGYILQDGDVLISRSGTVGRSGPFPGYSGQTEAEGLMGRIAWHEFDFFDSVILVTTVGARAMSTRLVSGKFSLSQNCALIIPRDSQSSSAFFESSL